MRANNLCRAFFFLWPPCAAALAPPVQVMYLFFITALWVVVQMTQLLSVAKSTTLVNVLHGVVSAVSCLNQSGNQPISRRS